MVTGKGGTGKTTVAGALALALAAKGRRTLLCEVEGRQGIAQLFDRAPLPYAETRLASGPDGGAPVYAIAIDAESALIEYLQMYYRLGRTASRFDRFGVIEFATTIAPGVRDVLLTGKVYEAAKKDRRGKDARTYDAIVLDAPPTGRIAQFLNVNSELAGLARMGPIKGQADLVMTLLRSPRTVVHLVTVLEEMPVQETIDGIAELRANDLPVGGVVVNLTRDRSLGPEALDAAASGTLPRERIAASLTQAGAGPEPVAADGPLVDALVTEARDHATRRRLEDTQRTALAGARVPTYELPRLPEGIDQGALLELSAMLTAQGIA
ncbi:ATPase [Nocardioidaceae bacterium]|nr:ATPase [Nocardioidaceae bacterium]